MKVNRPGGKDVKKILCIEDEPQMIDLIKLILENKGYQVLGAEEVNMAWK